MATSVPATWLARSCSAPSRTRIASVKSGPLVSTSAEEKAVDRLIPQNTMPTCSACPISPQAMKRGRSSRFGQVRATRFLKTKKSRRNASSGIVTKRMKRNGPTPSVSSRYLTKAKFTPHSTIVKSAATSDQRRADN